jgi:multidrug efflux pump
MVGGSSSPAVRIDVNPTQINAYGLQLEDVRDGGRRADRQRGQGRLLERDRHWHHHAPTTS